VFATIPRTDPRRGAGEEVRGPVPGTAGCGAAADLAGKTRRRMAAEEIADLDHLDAKLTAMKAELNAAVLASGPHLMDIHGIGPAGAARILADVGDVAVPEPRRLRLLD